MSDKLSLEGLIFQATKVDVSNNILTLTLNRPEKKNALNNVCLLYTSPSPRDLSTSRMPSSA